MLIRLLAAGLMVIALPLTAMGADCNYPMAAELGAGKLKTWSRVHVWFKRYGACDDGALGEGFTESVTVLLAKRWSQLPALSARAESDPQFRTFVLKHINASADEGNLKIIESNATSRCPARQAQLCAEFIARVRQQ